MTERVSVVIPARNEAAILEKCLDALAHQTYPADAIEVIVVDNKSTDSTYDLALGTGCLVVRSEASTVAGVRNAGVKLASGAILAFIDADCIPADDWIESGVRALRLEDCLTGAEVLPPPDAGWVARNWSFPLPGRQHVRCINSGNMFVPAHLFEALGGFDESLDTGEDCELCQRLARLAPVISDSSIRVVHMGVPRSLTEFFRREVWHGLGAFGTARAKWWDRPLLGTMAFALFSATQVWGLASTSPRLLSLATVGVVALCAVATAHRRYSKQKPGHVLALIPLHYAYFLARSMSLLLLLLPRRLRPYELKRHGARVSDRSKPAA